MLASQESESAKFKTLGSAKSESAEKICSGGLGSILLVLARSQESRSRVSKFSNSGSDALLEILNLFWNDRRVSFSISS